MKAHSTVHLRVLLFCVDSSCFTALHLQASQADKSNQELAAQVKAEVNTLLKVKEEATKAEEK